MPAIAVGAAVFAGAELATGAITLFSLAGVAAVGAIAVGVGVITGNQTLQKVGAVMGVVGGIGSFATGAFGAADAASTASANAADPLNTVMNAGASGGGGLDAATAAATNPLTNAASATAADTTGATVTNAATSDVASALPSSGVNTVGQSAASDGTAGEAAAQANTGGGLLNPNANMASQFPDTSINGSAAGGVAPTATTAPTAPTIGQGSPNDFIDQSYAGGATKVSMDSPLNRVLNFVKNNDKVSAALVNVAGNFVGSAFNPRTPAEIAALNAQAAANNAQAALAAQRQQTINASQPGANTGSARGSVFGTNNPAVYQSPATVGMPSLSGLPAVSGVAPTAGYTPPTRTGGGLLANVSPITGSSV